MRDLFAREEGPMLTKMDRLAIVVMTIMTLVAVV
jgi:hypothetical protein